MSLESQFLTMLLMILGGASLGLLFDTYRVLSLQVKPPRWILLLLDLVYWIAATLFVFRLLYHSNMGQVRLYVFLGLMIGCLLYALLLSRLYCRFLGWLIRVFLRLLAVLKKLADVLIVAPIIYLYKFLWVLLGFLAAISIFLYKIVLQLFHPVWKMALWLFRWGTRRFAAVTWLRKLGGKLSALWRRLF